MNRAAAYPPPWLGWALWGIGVVLYLAGFYQRVAPAVMTTELMRDFSISAASLGNLSAFYFYAYVAMQIPTGVLADRWGPRRLLAAGAVVAGAGSLLFALAPALIWANLGRFLIGGSVAVAFVALLKLASHWFPARRFSLAAGLALFWGVVGAVGGGVPLRLMVDHFGWRPVMLVSGLVTLLLAAAAWAFIRDDPRAWGYRSHAPELGSPGQAAPGPLAGLRQVLRYRNTWLLAWAPAGIAGPLLSFAGLWGVPFLQVRYALSPASAAALCSLLLIGFAVGGTLMGALSERLDRRKPLLLVGCGVAACGWALMIFLPGLPVWGFVFCAASTGLASGSMIISFAWGKESVPLPLAGTVAGVINMGIMLGPMILQPAIGWVLDALWDGRLERGVRVYSLGAYQGGLALMLAWTLLAVGLLLLARETFCRQQA
ncbi:MAG: MFS transporter [Desulfarculus sp.]|nr:MAG: MFS transporter [Desulfarculus sp.]